VQNLRKFAKNVKSEIVKSKFDCISICCKYSAQMRDELVYLLLRSAGAISSVPTDLNGLKAPNAHLIFPLWPVFILLISMGGRMSKVNLSSHHLQHSHMSGSHMYKEVLPGAPRESFIMLAHFCPPVPCSPQHDASHLCLSGPLPGLPSFHMLPRTWPGHQGWLLVVFIELTSGSTE
jgi:hypothetical protein